MLSIVASLLVCFPLRLETDIVKKVKDVLDDIRKKLLSNAKRGKVSSSQVFWNSIPVNILTWFTFTLSKPRHAYTLIYLMLKVWEAASVRRTLSCFTWILLLLWKRILLSISVHTCTWLKMLVNCGSVNHTKFLYLRFNIAASGAGSRGGSGGSVELPKLNVKAYNNRVVKKN